MLRKWCLSLIAVAGIGSIPVVAEASDCPMAPTVQSLQDCVQQAADTGVIDNSGVASSLLGKLRTAELTLSRDNPDAAWTAVNVLSAFIGEVEAQSGKHIDAEHAKHMVMHAQMVIEALRSATTQRSSSSR